ncbi:MAG: hypothetical protein ABIX01_14995 [Chitinophagaceae bacterium]
MDIQPWIKMANCIFELEKKLPPTDGSPATKRILDKMKNILEANGLQILNPIGEPFSETRTDVEATLTSDKTSKLLITEVLKPVIYTSEDGRKLLVQKAVVLVG